MEEMITNKIYARINDKKIVIKLFSSVFESPIDGDILIEEGNAEYHAHVQLKYHLVDADGNYNYKIIEGELIELTDEEKAELFPKVKTVAEPTLEEKYEELKAKNEELEACVMELAEIIGGME